MPSANTPIKVTYKSMAPTLEDSGADAGLSLLPVDWRDTVLYEWIVLEEMRAKKDLEEIPAQAEVLKAGIFDMVCGERQGKPWEQTMPRYAGSADVTPDDLLL